MEERSWMIILRTVVILSIVMILGSSSGSLIASASSVEPSVSGRNSVLVIGDIENPQENQGSCNSPKIISKKVSVNRNVGSNLTTAPKETKGILPRLGEGKGRFFLVSLVVLLFFLVLKKLEWDKRR